MKPHRSTPAPRQQPQRQSKQKNNKRTTQHTNSHQRTIWDYVRPILPPTLIAPININTPAPMQDSQSQVPQNQTPPATPVPINLPDSQIDAQQNLRASPPAPTQQTLNHEKHNKPWGDIAMFSNPTKNFCVLSKNIGTLNPFLLDTLAITEELINKGVSVFAAQETNIDWTPETTQLIQSQVRRNTPYFSLTTSCSTEKSSNWHKLGGTLLLALDHWTSHITTCSTDTPLGRWSYLEFVGKSGKRLIIVSAYQTCHQKFDTASDTVSAQQIHILQANGIANPNPQKIFLDDLIYQIKQWRQTNKEVLVCMDANENVDDAKANISRLYVETDLTDLHHHRYPSLRKPATHQRGSKPIDLMAGSPLTADALISAWICPFSDPPTIKGDHRLLGLDFDPEILFGNSATALAKIAQHGARSQQPQTVTKFCKRVITECTQHWLAERIDILMVTPTFHQNTTQNSSTLIRN